MQTVHSAFKAAFCKHDFGCCGMKSAVFVVWMRLFMNAVCRFWGVNAANAESSVPIRYVNVAVLQRETPAGLPDAVYRTAFSVFSTCNPAKAECVYDHYILQCGLIGRRFRLLPCSIRWNPIVFSTCSLCKVAKAVMKGGEGGVKITVFAARNARTGIAMRAFRNVFPAF